jgi:probable HAF family extracellular repeat protein
MNPSAGRTCTFLVLALLAFQSTNARPVLHIIKKMRGAHFTVPIDISANGGVLALNSERTNYLYQAARQVRPRPAMVIPMSFPSESTATGVSADGSVVVGFTYNAASLGRGFLWSKETGTIDLSPDPDLSFSCNGVSGNGHVAFGYYLAQNEHYRPYFWSAETGIQTLNISNYSQGSANGSSHDGNVIVGSVGSTNTGNFACRWVGRGDVELLDPAASNTYANAVTPDGSFIIGGQETGTGTSRGFYWAHVFGMQWVEPGENYRRLEFSDVSADAQRIVGSAYTSNSAYVAVLWTAEDGLRELNELYGSVLPRGATFSTANAVSADGRWIAGAIEIRGETKGYVLDTGKHR